MGKPWLLLLAYLCLVEGGNVRRETFHWGYDVSNGPSVWPRYYPLCVGWQQSPIDLPVPAPSNYQPKPFDLAYEWFAGRQSFQIVNNGHTVQVNLPDGFMVSGGGLPPWADYTAAQFHFHWGANPSTGSEHTIGNRHSPLEMHVVLWDKYLGSFDNAKTVQGGLAVLGFLFQLGPSNTAFQPIVNALTQVNLPDSTSSVLDFDLLQLVVAAMQRGYFRYSGSLTTPTCNESVVWTIFMRPINISQDQLNQLTKLKNHGGLPLVNNFRPTQPLNYRVVELFGSP